MTEMRTSVSFDELISVMPVMATALMRLNPPVILRTETLRSVILVRIFFPSRDELELFRQALQEEHIELKKWSVCENELKTA